MTNHVTSLYTFGDAQLVQLLLLQLTMTNSPGREPRLRKRPAAGPSLTSGAYDQEDDHVSTIYTRPVSLSI